MLNQKQILFTGGSGLLGGEMRKLLPEADYPSSAVFNITNYDQMEKYLDKKDCKILIHAGAYTLVPQAENEVEKVIDLNIIGTANIVKLCKKNNIKLVYISTDYVFRGDRGLYKEGDELYPVNKYAWSKLGGECAVQLYDNSLIIRTTFGTNVFPYPKAFIDQWTSRQSVSEIAKKIVLVLDKEIRGVIHLGGPRQTIYEYAKSLDESKELGKRSIAELDLKLPKDTSLDMSKFESLK
jgi:dTDP-4-dehydrorhamnose reductase